MTVSKNLYSNMIKASSLVQIVIKVSGDKILVINLLLMEIEAHVIWL